MRLDCTSAVGNRSEQLAVLEHECSCKGPVPQPCGSACEVLNRCTGLAGFNPQAAHSCQAAYMYSFSRCSVWCGMSTVLKAVSTQLAPSNLVRNLVIAAAFFGALVLLMFFMRQ